MRKRIMSVLVIGMLATAPAVFAAVQTKTPSTAPASKKAAAPAGHAVRGVVKSMDATTLVITKSGKKPTDMTFTINSSTMKEGAPEVGSTVSVRYHQQGKSMIATAIATQPAATTHK
jgi:hypothetical protein